MKQECENPDIFINPLPEVIDTLFENIDRHPARFTDEPTVIQSGVFLKYSFPIRFDKKKDNQNYVRIDTVYDYEDKEFILESSTAERFLRSCLDEKIKELEKSASADMKKYHVAKNINRHIIDRKVIAYPEYIPRKGSEEGKLLIYGISEFVGSDLPFKGKTYINFDKEALTYLFRNVSIIPAKITYKPVIRFNFSPVRRYSIGFTYHNQIDANFDNKQGFYAMDASILGGFMNLLDAKLDRDIVGKDISIYVRYFPETEKRIVCGIGPIGHYKRRYPNQNKF